MEPITIGVLLVGAVAIVLGARLARATRHAARQLDAVVAAAAVAPSDAERAEFGRVLSAAHDAGTEAAIQDDLVWEWVQVRAQRDEWAALADAPGAGGGLAARLARRAITERQRRTFGGALKLVFGRFGYEEMLAHLGIEHSEAGALITAWNRENARQ